MRIFDSMLVSGSWDRTAKVPGLLILTSLSPHQLWDLKTGACLRSLDHEMQVNFLQVEV